MRVTPSSVPAELNKPQLAQSSIGQYDVRVTPLQVAMIAAGIGNRGMVMKPYLVKSVIGSDLSVIESADAEELSQAVSPEVAARADPDDGGRRPGRHRHRGADPRCRRRRQDRHRPARRGRARRTPGSSGSHPPNNPEIAVAVVAEDGGNAGSEAGGGAVAAPHRQGR